MSYSNILYSSVTEIKKLLSNKEISALELTQFSLERIKETNNKTNAFLYVATDTAIEDAKNIDKKIIGKKAKSDAWAEGRAESQAEEFDEFASGGLAYLLGE